MAAISERLDALECGSIKTLFQDMLKIINSQDERINWLEDQFEEKWTEMKDPASGKVFFYNNKTHESKWIL